ncbi:S9 family peptidase [Shewanella donghaensis]|uniref:S9 family peptidase n=1 Tax=Shewanella donghaensis TaxID=238836 RepID=UPI0011843D9E|nr:S9 family peptidase [Shewanella donghaensis]
MKAFTLGLSKIGLISLIGLTTQALASNEPHKITIDDFFDIGVMKQVTLSPNGKEAIWVESRWDKELDKSQADLWKVETTTRKTQRLTFSNENESSAVWSPDGQYIYFITKRTHDVKKAPFNGKNQVFRMSKDGADMQPMTKESTGVNAFQLSKDGQHLYFTGNKTVDETDHWSSMRATHGAPQYGHGSHESNPLFVIDLQHYKQQTLIDDGKVVWQFSVNEDQSKIARIITDDNELVKLEGWSDIDIFDVKKKSHDLLQDKQWRAQAPSPYGWLLGLDWHDDNKQLAFRIDFDGHPGKLFVANTSSNKITEITRPDSVTLNGADIKWRPKSDEICYRAADFARVKLYCTEFEKGEQADTRSVINADLVMGSYDFTPSGKQLVLSHNGLTHFSDMFIADADNRRAKIKRITDINAQVKQWQLPQISIVKWKAPDGSDVEGILELPHGYDKNQGRLPLVVQIHGGPTAATPYALQHRSYGRGTFSADGWAILSPNYRGSTGYGDKFLTDLVGREHDIEVKDILAGVDHLIAEGIVDEDKMAVMGWSNGGYLTNALISTTTRFKAASSGAGVFDQRLQWMLEDTPGHVVNFMEGLPWDKPEAYTHGSSLSTADKIKTPTLIHIGENDQRVPVGHAQGLYRALKHYLDVPVELVIYPGEGHGLSHYQHRKAKMEWDKKWFDYYVLGIE